MHTYTHAHVDLITEKLVDLYLHVRLPPCWIEWMIYAGRISTANLNSLADEVLGRRRSGPYLPHPGLGLSNPSPS